MNRKPGFAGILHKCNDWDGFKRHVSALSQNEKGNAFEVLTKYYLQLDPKYTTQLKSVWSLGEVPSKVRKNLNLPGPDEGIDLVAESKEGEFWAVQCKYREDETKSLTRKELSTFTDLAFNICKHISLGLVCANAERFSHKLALYRDRLTLCHSDNWRALDTEFFHCVHELLEHKTASIMPFAPFPYQRVAVENAYQHFMTEGRSRGKLIMPCGTGKSLTSYWIAEALKAQTILVAVPSLALIRQTVEVWARESVANGRDLHWIAVCSDESVAANESDDISFLTQDLGIRVYSDPGEIARWLEVRQDGRTVVFSTYQSGRRTAEAAKISGMAFDLGIFDEAHKTVGKRNSLFSHLLHDENVAIKRRIFMTATERHYRGESDNIVSMRDSELYGDTFEMLSFKRSLESDPPVLSDYRIVTIVVTRDEVASLIKGNLFLRPDKGEWDEDVEAEILAALIALRKSMQKHPIKHAVSFHSSVARARAFADYNETFAGAFPEYGKVDTYHVSGKTPTSVRSRRMKEFAESKRSLVTNARCLTEGVDVPKIDCVLFADPKRSKIDIVQAVGRALRKAEGKRLGYVIVPVLSDAAEETSKENFRDSAFDSVLLVLRALAANDERIVDYFRTVAQGRRWARAQIPFEIDIPDGLVIDSEDFINSIELNFWSRLAKLSWRPFEEARDFARSLGLKDQKEWREYSRNEIPGKVAVPEDIPTNPWRTYADAGWIGIGDWLGSGSVATFVRKYRPFEEARTFVQALGLKGETEWRRYCTGNLPDRGTLPKDIPAKPSRTYKDEGWAGMGDWLGTGNIASNLRQYRSFNQAREFVHGLGLRNQREWGKYCKGQLPEKGSKPDDIPANPNVVYQTQGWTSLGDWLGTRTIASRLRQYQTFEEARAFARSLGLRGDSEWKKYCKGELPEKGVRPKDIPAMPNAVYRKKDGSALETGWELGASLPDCGSTGLSREPVPLSEVLGSEASHIGEDTAKANCTKKERSRQIFRQLLGAFTKARVGSIWEIGLGRVLSLPTFVRISRYNRHVSLCAALA